MNACCFRRWLRIVAIVGLVACCPLSMVERACAFTWHSHPKREDPKLVCIVGKVRSFSAPNMPPPEDLLRTCWLTDAVDSTGKAHTEVQIDGSGERATTLVRDLLPRCEVGTYVILAAKWDDDTKVFRALTKAEMPWGDKSGCQITASEAAALAKTIKHYHTLWTGPRDNPAELSKLARSLLDAADDPTWAMGASYLVTEGSSEDRKLIVDLYKRAQLPLRRFVWLDRLVTGRLVLGERPKWEEQWEAHRICARFNAAAVRKAELKLELEKPRAEAAK